MSRRMQYGAAMLLLAITTAMAGCRHKQPAPLPIPPAMPVPIAPPPSTTSRIPTIPVPPVPLTPVEVPAKKVKKTRKKIAAVTAPNQPSATPLANAAPGGSPASAGAAPASVPAALGTLTLGEGNGSSRQTALESISSLERRLSALPAELVKAQREQIGRVEHFAEEAERALKGGDAEGAQTLATKGKLLLDDLLK